MTDAFKRDVDTEAVKIYGGTDSTSSYLIIKAKNNPDPNKIYFMLPATGVFIISGATGFFKVNTAGKVTMGKILTWDLSAKMGDLATIWDKTTKLVTGDIDAGEFNVANKLVKLDGSALVPDAQIPDIETLGYGGAFANAQIPDLSAKVFSLCLIKDEDATPVDNAILRVIDGVVQIRNSANTGFRELDLNSIPVMTDAKIPNLETLSYGAAFAVAQIPDLDAAKIISGIFDDARLPAEVLWTDLARTVTSLITFDRDPNAPFTVSAGSALVANLNADLWDGYQFADYLDQAVKQASSPTFAGLTLTGNLVLGNYEIQKVAKVLGRDSDGFLRLSSTDVAGHAGEVHLYTQDNVGTDRVKILIKGGLAAGSGVVEIYDQLKLPTTGSGAGILIGGDALIFRGAANRLDLASGDSLNLVLGGLLFGGTEVLTSGRVLQNVTANASIITAGTLGIDRIPILTDAKIPDLETLSYGAAFALAQIPTMDDAHIPNVETLSYTNPFAMGQIPSPFPGWRHPTDLTKIDGDDIYQGGHDEVHVTTSTSTTSIAYVDLSGMSISYTSKGGRLLLLFWTEWCHNWPGNAKAIRFIFNVDGSVVHRMQEQAQTDRASCTAISQHISGFNLYDIGAGAHTIKVQWQVNGGTGYACGRKLVVIELLKD